MGFVFEVKNASPAKKSEMTMEKVQNNGFVTLFFFKRNVANILLKNTTIDVRK